MSEKDILLEIKGKLEVLVQDSWKIYNDNEPGYKQCKAKGRISGLESGIFWLDYYLKRQNQDEKPCGKTSKLIDADRLKECILENESNFYDVRDMFFILVLMGALNLDEVYESIEKNEAYAISFK